MKSCLLHPDRAFAAQTHLPPDADALVQDLGLGPLLAGMAQGDEFLAEVGKQVLLSATTCDVDTIRYRQAVRSGSYIRWPWKRLRASARSISGC